MAASDRSLGVPGEQLVRRPSQWLPTHRSTAKRSLCRGDRGVCTMGSGYSVMDEHHPPGHPPSSQRDAHGRPTHGHESKHASGSYWSRVCCNRRTDKRRVSHSGVPAPPPAVRCVALCCGDAFCSFCCSLSSPPAHTLACSLSLTCSQSRNYRRAILVERVLGATLRWTCKGLRADQTQTNPLWSTCKQSHA